MNNNRIIEINRLHVVSKDYRVMHDIHLRSVQQLLFDFQES